MESHGSPYTDGERLFTSFDASANYMAMLQDVTMHPLFQANPCGFEASGKRVFSQSATVPGEPLWV